MFNLTTAQLSSLDKFVHEYIQAENAATGSRYDANANVTNKNVITLLGEMIKPLFIQYNRYTRHQQMVKDFGIELADDYLDDIKNCRIYQHDETHYLPYCLSISLFPFLQNGSKCIGGITEKPKHLSSFCGGLINLMNQIAAQVAGAVAIPSLMVCFDYFARKDYGENYLETHSKEIKQELQHLVYYLCEPCSGRNGQSIFYNVSMFDRPYLEGLYGDFVYPDDFSKVNIDSVVKLQKFFLQWFNKEREKSLLTFPVITCAMVYDKNKQIIDQEFKATVCEELSHGNGFFVYLSDSVDSLSSCCFDGSQMTLSKSSNGVNYMSFEELFKANYNQTKRNFTIFHNGSWKKGKVIRIDKSNKKMYSITTANNKNMIVTEDHIFPTLFGDKAVSELTTEDYLLHSNLQLDTYADKDIGLKRLHGIFIGAYLGDGSTYVRNKLSDNAFGKYSITLSLNAKKMKVLKPVVEKIAQEFEGTLSCLSYPSPVNNCHSIVISSKRIYDFIKTWVFGKYCYEKEINLDCLLQSREFRKGIYQGYYLTDGGNSNRIYTTSTKLVNQMEAIFTSLGIATIINTEDRTDEDVVIREQAFNRNYPLYCIRWYDIQNKRSAKDIYIIKNNSTFFKIKSIVEYETTENFVYCFEMQDSTEPYFTLPNGVITHNCRLRNESKNEFSFTLGNVGEMTGSVNVITINMNRFIQDTHRLSKQMNVDFSELLISELRKKVQKIHKYHVSIRKIYEFMRDSGMYPVHDANFIKMERQFSTIGINGLVEGAEYLGYDITPNEQYMNFCATILKTISTENKAAKELYGFRFNTEFVPGENAGHKLAQWDKRDGYVVPRECYNSYFYRVEDDGLSVIEKAKMHGKLVTEHLDGGSAVHYNMDSYMTAEQYSKLIDINAYVGVNYFCTNILITCCEEESCGHINKNTEYHCVKCGSKNISHATRIIGFLKKIKNFSKARQEEAALRYYHKDRP